MNAKELAWELQHIPHSDESAENLIKDYAKREIEKDRERVIENVKDGSNDYWNKRMRDTPIELD